MTGTAFSLLPAPLRAGSPAEPPRAVLVAFIALLVALLAGVAEAVERAALEVDREADLASLATGIGTRLAIYSIVLAVAICMTYGDRWARLLLTVGIGVVGLISLIVEPLAMALSATELGDLFTGLPPEAALVGAFRTVHIAAVLIAIPALYTRPAGRYFRGDRRTRVAPRTPTECAGSRSAARTRRAPRRG